MKWFKHLTASGSDPDIGELIDQIGFEGYYLFFRTIEIMSTEFNIDNPGQNLFNFGWFLNQFSRKITKKKLINFLEITSKNKRIMYSLNGKSISLNCPKLKNLTDEYTRQKPYRSYKEVTQKVTNIPDKIVTKVTPKIKDTRLEIQDIKKEETIIQKDNVNEIDVYLTQLLITLMQKNDPKSSIIRDLTENRQRNWINDCRLLRERDKRSPEDIKRVIEFSQSDDFWKSNILSMSKLRKQFGQLWIKSKPKQSLQEKIDAWANKGE